MKFTPAKRWIAAALVFALFAAWVFFAAQVIVDQGYTMVGFHPLILLIFPGAIAAVSIAVTLMARGQWQLAIGLSAGAAGLLILIYNAHALEVEAWRSTIEHHSATNEKAMEAIQYELSQDKIAYLSDDETLTPLEWFQWYGENHISAPNGVYFGFKFAGVPHVRIQKIRHGYQGIALFPADRNPDILTDGSSLTYSRVGSSGWYIWTFSR